MNIKQLINLVSRWYFTKKALPYWCIFGLDCLIVWGASLLTYALSHGISHTLLMLGPLMLTYGVYLLCYVVGFRMFHTYSGVIRYSSFVDLQRLGFAMLTGLWLIVLLKYVLQSDEWLTPIRMKDIVEGMLVATSLMWVVRILVKHTYDSTFNDKRAKRVFIYGVKEGGIGLAKSIRNQKPSKYIIKGFVSDKADMENRYLMGLQVHLNDEELTTTMLDKDAHILVVSPLKNQAIRENKEMVDRLMEAGISILIYPDVLEWDGRSDLSHQALKEVDIEDLLPRDKIEMDLEVAKEQLTGKNILITGAAGSIGSELVRQVAQFAPRKMILIDQAETPLHDIRLMMARQWPTIEAHTIVSDICQQKRMENIFQRYPIDYVFHAAAYKHVPMMEDNPGESIRNNVEGTRNIADLAVKYGVRKFVMISTDKAVNPTNVMGCSKRICEIYVQSLDKAIKDGSIAGKTQFVTTRFGNVLGSNGSVIPLFREQIKRGGPITVTHENIIRYFMLIPEACKLVLEAGTQGKGGEIFVFDMGKPVKIVDLAKRMIRLSNAHHVKIEITGLREGEKLYEEMLNEAETTKPTFHPKIKIAQVREYDYATARRQVEDLVTESLTADDMDIVSNMKRMVPEFISQNSKYEQLDKQARQ